MSIDKKFLNLFTKATEKAAIGASRFIGKNDKIAADKGAVDPMRRELNKINMEGTVVIGEGEMDEAPMLYIGERLGTLNGPKFDIAVDPLEGTKFTANGEPNAFSVLAISEKGGLLSAPDTYMEKIVIGSNLPKNLMDIDYGVEKNIDLRKALRLGTYCNVTEFFDLYTGSMDTYTYKLSEQLREKLGTEDKIQVNDAFSENFSRIMVRMSDRGVLDNDGVTTDSGRDIADMAKSTSRYNILFSQAINITVPLNINLKAGDLINAIFPAIEASEIKRPDANQSGRYLVQQVRHHFQKNQNLSYLRLVRDSYGLYGKN